MAAGISYELTKQRLRRRGVIAMKQAGLTMLYDRSAVDLISGAGWQEWRQRSKPRS